MISKARFFSLPSLSITGLMPIFGVFLLYLRPSLMDENLQKEQFSNAYIRAVAAVAGYNVYKPEVDDDSIDWGIAARGGRGTLRSPKLELQLKCTASDIRGERHIAFPLKIKNYNELRHENYQVPRILVVVLVPSNTAEWIQQSEESLIMHKCGYWLSLRGRESVPNDDTITVHLSREQIFSVDQLCSVMDRIAQGGIP
jgi:hypothetical protein